MGHGQRIPGKSPPASVSKFLQRRSTRNKQFTAKKSTNTRISRLPTNKQNNPTANYNLSTEDIVSLLDRRKRGDELTIREIDELLESHREANSGQEQERGWRVKQATGEVKTVEGTVVQRYGTLDIHKKDQEVVRVMSHNINTLSFWKAHNVKVEKLKHVLRAYKIDVLGLQETNVNFAALKHSNNLASTLRHGADEIRSVVAHNTRETENIPKSQPGGTAVVMRDELVGFIKDRGRDETGLGMFCWFKTEGKDGVSTVFMSAYAPCKSQGLGTYFQQIKRYCQMNQITLEPKDFFQLRLVDSIRSLRAKRIRVVLMIDSNENVYSGHLTKRLSAGDIRMREAVHSSMPGQEGPYTHFRGSEPIDGIYISDEIELVSASYLPFIADLGDHRAVVMDIRERSVVGVSVGRIVPVKARRLNSKNGRHVAKYLAALRLEVSEKQIEERLTELEAEASFPPTQQFIVKMQEMGVMMEQNMKKAEKVCRNLFPAHYAFSPPIKNCLDKCHLFQWILRKHAGRKVNGKNLRRFAERLGLWECVWYDVPDVVRLLREERERAKNLMKEAPYLRRQFLECLLQEALDNGNTQEEHRIQSIIKGEQQRATWQNINRVTKPRSNPSVTRVEVTDEDGGIIEYTTKQGVERALRSELSPRFKLAESAPLCKGSFYELLGVDANTTTAIDILEGNFIPPAGTDQATLLLLGEISRIWTKIGEGEVGVAVSQEDFQYYWRKARERTSSSMSGLHFGHYKAIAKDDKLSEIWARQLSLISATGVAPERWSKGMSVMLEKIAGVAAVTKLRSILLLEADFNFHNKLIFGQRMMELARTHDLVPEEIYSAKGKTAEDAILQQVLLYDIARITKAPLVVAQVDAAQCYDRVAHVVAALIVRAFGVHASSTHAMLRPLHEMQFYLRTGFGDSDTYFGGKGHGNQGLAQGNGAAPIIWQSLSTAMLNVHRQQGHGVEIVCPISRVKIKQVGVAFVDDTNLWSGLERDQTLLEAAAKSQEAQDCWGQLLYSSGGALKGEKCSAIIHEMTPEKGSWRYYDQKAGGRNRMEEDDDELEDLPVLTVPQGDKDAEAIKILSTDTAVKNLGCFTRPDGNPETHFAYMRERVTRWTAQIKNGGLPRRSVWMSYTFQLWSGLRYGLGACSASLKQLHEGLGTADYYLLSNLGVARSITREWRYIPATFGGMALYSLPVETTGATLSMMLQHYLTDAAIGITMSAALEHLQLELGVHDCPFNYKYEVWEGLASDTWMKALWEKIDRPSGPNRNSAVSLGWGRRCLTPYVW